LVVPGHPPSLVDLRERVGSTRPRVGIGIGIGIGEQILPPARPRTRAAARASLTGQFGKPE
jgi:hypothetical protein